MTPIALIHEAAGNAPPGILDEPVYSKRDLKLVWEMTDAGFSRATVNVPLGSIVALSRDHFWTGGDTWRDAARRLHGQDWDASVFEYFTSEIGASRFPGAGSRGALEISVIGGACLCSNGNHRLVAAKTWLVAKAGDGASLRGVHVQWTRLAPALRSLLERAAVNQQTVALATVDVHDVYTLGLGLEGAAWRLLVSLDERNEEVYAWDGCNLAPVSRGGLFHRLRRRFRHVTRLAHLQWRRVPVTVLRKLLDDSWISAAAYRAHTQ